MDQVRNFAQSNRSSILNIIYLIAILVVVYYIVMYYMGGGGETKDTVLLKNKLATSVAKGTTYTVSNAGRAGAEYTVSVWIYINDYKGTNASNKITGILNLLDNKEGYATASGMQSLLFVGLHPTQPKMIIRAGSTKEFASADPLVKYTTSGSTSTWGGDSATLSETGAGGLTACDVMDVDMQRWINVAVAINGRILDVYMDGKLARSCILDNVQKTSTDGTQIIHLIPTSGHFNGYVSGLQFSNYAVPPDAIYARYQAGPYFSAGFLDYLMDKLGIKITYTGTTGNTTTTLGELLGQ